MTERTFVMLKPSAVERGLIGEIISRFERKGLRLVAMKALTLSRAQAEELYSVHRGKHFYEELVNRMSGRRVVVMVLEGRSAVSVVRKLTGATDPVNAEPGTIRGDLGLDLTDNLVHASDSAESFSRECSIFFSTSELT
ncbi:MAG: nucleoside-diphosphate kinase [Candidatus Caldarchaeales archaeon]